MTPDGNASQDAQAQAMLERALAHLGASAEQARTMATQLLKRARQVAMERGISESAAMAELLHKVIAGRKGEYTGQSSPVPPTSEPR